MGSLFGSSTIKGTRITEFSQTSATVGDPQPWGYGTATYDGQVIFAALPPKEHVKKKRQGKGGVKQETYTYTMSYAIAFCQGPVYAIRWIKRNGKVVYSTDPNAPTEDKLYALKWMRKVKFHLGTESQLPDSVIEAVKGTGRVSAHRGVVYISVQDDDVTDGGGAVPSYEACITSNPPDVYLSSKPYPNDMAPEGAGSSMTPQPGNLRLTHHNGYIGDPLGSSLAVLNGELRSPIVKISPDVNAVGGSVQFADGDLHVALSNTKMDVDSMVGSLSVQSGSLQVKLIKYQYWPSESVNSTLSLPPGGYLGV